MGMMNLKPMMKEAIVPAGGMKVGLLNKKKKAIDTPPAALPGLLKRLTGK